MSLNADILEQSFEKIKPQSEQFAASFYGNLFEGSPEAKPLFASTDMAKQQKMLVAALALVVDNLRKPDVLTKAVKDLGARHVKYGTKTEHYPLVGAALLKTFEQYLGGEWTPEVKQAWADAYGVLSDLMLEGAESVAAS